MTQQTSNEMNKNKEGGKNSPKKPTPNNPDKEKGGSNRLDNQRGGSDHRENERQGTDNDQYSTPHKRYEEEGKDKGVAERFPRQDNNSNPSRQDR